MKPSLQVRLSQHLALTPQLQQSIRLLQLSTLELQQEVEQMLDQNPFLEADEEPRPAERAGGARRAQPSRPADARRPTRRREREEAAFEAARRPRGIDGTDFGARRAPRMGERHRGRRLRRHPRAAQRGRVGAPAPDDDQEPQDRTAAAPSLQDHLRGQLALMRLSPEDRAALWVLIESLDGDGYLADALEEIAERLAGLPMRSTRPTATSCSSACSARSSGCKASTRPASARATSPSA